MQAVIGSILGAALVAVPSGLPATPQVTRETGAVAAFERLKLLVGRWQSATNPASPLRIEFAVTAGGTVLVERWLRGDQPHSMTVYHLDGDAIATTHYCPQGNQPRLRSIASVGPTSIGFMFHDATGLDTADESYLSALSFELADARRVVRRETYRRGGSEAASELILVRAD